VAVRAPATPSMGEPALHRVELPGHADHRNDPPGDCAGPWPTGLSISVWFPVRAVFSLGSEPTRYGEQPPLPRSWRGRSGRTGVVRVLPAGGCVPGGIYRLGGLRGAPIGAAARRYAVFQQKERHVVVAVTARVPVHGC
jgi:hypothetical protein